MSAHFKDAFIEAIRYLNLSEAKLSDMFSVSIPTIRSWKIGTSSPHPAFQVFVLRRFQKLILQRAEDAP